MGMICSLCGCQFSPKATDEQLMRLGKIQLNCPKCVLKSVPTAAPGTRRTVARDPNAVLSRVDVFDANNIAKRWMSERVLPPKVEFARRRGRGADLHVFVISASSGNIYAPRPHYIRTNLAWFQGRGLNLRFWKDPFVQEDTTGLAEIEIPRQDVLGIEDTNGLEVIVRLKNDGWIRIQYHN